MFLSSSLASNLLSLFLKNSHKSISEFLESNNIETRSMLAGNITKHPAYKKSHYRISGTLKNADRIMHDSFFIGLHPGITKKDISYVLTAFSNFFKQY